MSKLEAPLHHQTLNQLSRLLDTKQISAAELTAHFLDRIEALDPFLNAFRNVDREGALAQARAADTMRSAGSVLSPLHGVPFAAKDLFDVSGMPTTAGCKLLEHRIADSDAAVIARLRASGMILLGKTNTVQFAFGGAGINHHHGTPHNPWHPVPHLPGGSSSGSAVAVAAGLAPMALGTDTGGSVRIPAALCGITGLKTTVGQISRAGVYPLSQTLDSVGPLCRDTEDTQRVYELLRGPDPNDPSTMRNFEPALRSAAGADLAGLRIAIARGLFFDDADPQVTAAIQSAGEALRAGGANVTEIEFELARETLEVNASGAVIAAEAYANNKALVDNNLDELDPVVAARLARGQTIGAADYLQMLDAWSRLRAKAIAQFDEVDILLCPSTAWVARPVAEVDASADAYASANMMMLRNTSIGNVLDLCGLSVPGGLDSNGLPIGVMLYAAPGRERLLFRAGRAFQLQTSWHTQTPPLDWIAAPVKPVG